MNNNLLKNHIFNKNIYLNNKYIKIKYNCKLKIEFFILFQVFNLVKKKIYKFKQ